mmetsp:Transcript_87180/g.154383  ORF Transcript_87180/g.154383 Transcript_87180/m.154383 type:complete len:188 (-) Transcript_87180:59-622(-)
MGMSSNMEPIQRRRVEPRNKEIINLKIMIVGDAGVGKSTLATTFCAQGSETVVDDEPTVGADFKVRRLTHAGKDFRMNIYDASGDNRFIEVRNEFYKEMQGLMLTFDVTSRRSFQNLEKWMDEAAKYCQGEPKCVVVGTKTDLGTRLVQEQAAKDWAKGHGMQYFEVSAAQNKNVENPFKELASRLS